MSEMFRITDGDGDTAKVVGPGPDEGTVHIVVEQGDQKTGLCPSLDDLRALADAAEEVLGEVREERLLPVEPLTLTDFDGDPIYLSDEADSPDQIGYLRTATLGVNLTRQHAREIRDYLTRLLGEERKAPPAGTATIAVEPDLSGFREALAASLEKIAREVR